MPGVDAEPRQARARRRDVGLALPVEALAVLGAGHDEPVLLELAHEVRCDGGAVAELGLVDLVLAVRDPDGAAPRPLGGRARARRAPPG